MQGKTRNIYLYTRYERFWHWLQMALILILLVTGLEVHGIYNWLGFHTAVTVHNFAGLTWLIAFAFFVFWVFTTGEWKQYIPTTKKMIEVIRYYVYGIFRGESHPVPKRKEAKHNPLHNDDYRLSLLELQLLAGLGIPGILSWTYRLDSYGRCFCYFLICYRTCLHDHHRAQHLCSHQSHD